MRAKLFFLLLTFIIINSYSVHSYNSWYRLYFTQPGLGVINHDNPQSGLISIISNAEKSIYGAFFELSSPEIIDAILKAKSRNIDIKIVLDDHILIDQKTNKGSAKIKSLNQLRHAEIQIVFDERKPFMHNKFAVIDEKIVWTGSYNLTKNCTRKNNNNAIRITSEKLASIFLDEFYEMFDDKIFGNTRDGGPFSGISNSNESKYHVNIEGTDINAYFSPENRVEKIIIKRLKKAKRSIYFMAFSFTSEGISEVMIAKNRDGVKVRGIFEKKGSRSGHSQYTRMKLEGLDVSLDRNKGTMHHKVIVIDENIVIMGSYNFSKNADKRNDENILIIQNEVIANKFIQEYNKIR